MQQPRRTLKLRPAPEPERVDTDDVAPTAVLAAAIAGRTRILATYNRVRIELAPHILYTKHDEPFVDGVVLARDGKPPKEIKFGSFKLAGLSELATIARTFVPSALFDRSAERYADTTLATLDG